jgi:hypothetical protein
MAHYSSSEIREIFKKLSEEPTKEVEFIKFERLGVEVDSDVLEDEEGVNVGSAQSDRLTLNCVVCNKVLMTPHLLDLHVVENHDSYFDIQKDKKPMVSLHLRLSNNLIQS